MRAPILLDIGEVPGPDVFRPLPGIVRRLYPAGGCAEEDEPGDPVGMRRGQHRAEDTEIGQAHQHGALRTCRVQDSDHVVDVVLEQGNVFRRESVRDPLSATVDEDQAAERGDALQEARVEGVLPDQVEIRERREVQEVDRPFAHHRVGDPDLAVPSEPDLRTHGAILFAGRWGRDDRVDELVDTNRLRDVARSEERRVGKECRL